MKRHLAVQSRPPIRRGACGHEHPAQWAHDPAEVTCYRCSRTLQMADAEIAKQLKLNRSNQKGSAT